MEAVMLSCSVCQQNNVVGYKLCTRCGAHVNRSLPPLLVIESALTREVIWGISLGGLALPIVMLGVGLLAAWQIWAGVGFDNYWSLTGVAALTPGTLFTLSILPPFHRVRSAMLGLGMVALLALVAAGIAGIFVAIYFFYESVE